MRHPKIYFFTGVWGLIGPVGDIKAQKKETVEEMEPSGPWIFRGSISQFDHHTFASCGARILELDIPITQTAKKSNPNVQNTVPSSILPNIKGTKLLKSKICMKKKNKSLLL